MYFEIEAEIIRISFLLCAGLGEMIIDDNHL